MKLWARMLWALLSGSGGRRGGILGLAFSSWQSHPPLPGLLSPTGLVSHWTRVFEKRGIPEARESSEYIVAHVLGAKTFQNLKPVLWTQPLTPQQLQCIQVLCSRRLQRVPVQYILGEWDFRGLSLKMVPPVFIPRPETEELVEWVLEEVAQRSNVVEAQGGPLILEVGCGSGAISLSLLSQLPQSQVIAVDKEEAAINLTYENAQRLRLQNRIQIIPFDVTSVGSWTHLLPWGPMDLIVSNPPYVFHHDMEQLAPEIRSYEDPVALDGGEEGMDIITRILTLAPQFLKDSGYGWDRSIFLEVEPRHPELVSNWLQSHPDLCLNLVAIRRDFCERPRFLHVQRSGP
ncbi:MTRF1L release factor glutamine methyltransferase isoform X1 [Urocitellus parryii]|uniref:hemK methyltransferase family member 1 isoform X1 n=1 Tax=Urocitellus parryii TaxID=9999 RepID=UPI000E560DCE|nr:hemK methyltransferase family member 1 isoform X1 [Urocitellus parryii]XP_026239821.1 hemK methyltransferase family member 1 isoform X1 [Urocitellus parryii]XP_026239822.1 hemK methyltransferase family member 1 isoform X1 [Urocitellus parryii]XP_026239823.1 hemK methyltransferase family member 1 isoform X1 [Urocitellus parryii]XP_026239824.1 hemK methyltransferase family member 1 isoform X1 [Urocitellus parryii]XP_026239825.1 hemK methyltransferase family member 1 isoform X1 [Urocitellus pa